MAKRDAMHFMVLSCSLFFVRRKARLEDDFESQRIVLPRPTRKTGGA
jgi:hypothetical protein|tara:strand:+ start:1298 stop:1438 length:141 start_codon:yes stop_codon:yes gene_type:complete